MTYLLDTNACIALFRGHAEVNRRVRATNPDDIYLCTPVIAELYVGAYKSDLRRQNMLLIEELLRDYDCLAFSTREALKFADVTSQMAAIGKSGTTFDMQIASIALSHGMALVTSDSDFSNVPDLQTEDWTILA